MLSKEEIKKQDREHIKKVLAENKNYIFEFDTDNIKTDDILEYINQLETKLEKAYWEGYIAKQNEAMEICKQCKYINKVKHLESREQKLIEKLEEDKIELIEELKYNITKREARMQLNLVNKYLEILK